MPFSGKLWRPKFFSQQRFRGHKPELKWLEGVGKGRYNLKKSLFGSNQDTWGCVELKKFFFLFSSHNNIVKFDDPETIITIFWNVLVEVLLHIKKNVYVECLEIFQSPISPNISSNCLSRAILPLLPAWSNISLLQWLLCFNIIFSSVQIKLQTFYIKCHLSWLWDILLHRYMHLT